ncbi:hypothetical protein K7432_009137 [Basidiobolus ranarum]|uniref:Carboxypeptidase n=1 Tax=Basidiobolus ranarum TaxID=34480 RepID=A0ABR2WQS6_9FUNG
MKTSLLLIALLPLTWGYNYQAIPGFKKSSDVLEKSSQVLLTRDVTSTNNQTLGVKQPKICDPSVKQYAGYLDIAADKHLYYWFFESRNKPATDPVVLWLNGGPGCSSFTGILMELGPCRVRADGSGVDRNPYSWNNNANVIFLDQPTNVGFSWGANVSTTVQSGKDVDSFLRLFFKTYPQYANHDFHIFGESYGGHYIPEIAKDVVENNSNSTQKINLKSVGIGNGWIDPRLQEKYYAPQACNGPYGAVLSKETCKKMYAAVPQCYQLATKCYQKPTFKNCDAATTYCSNHIENLYYQSGLNPYDVRKKCDPNSSLCYDIEAGIDIWLNRPEIRSELGVAKEVGKFESCSNAVGDNFSKTPDNMLNFADRLPVLLKAGIRVLLYAGDADFICNWMGNKAVALGIQWSGTQNFNGANDTLWRVNGTDAGEVRTYDKLTFARVFKAGHMVPFDQPEAALNLLNTWVTGETFAQ